jgi:hypothetical protein
MRRSVRSLSSTVSGLTERPASSVATIGNRMSAFRL